MRIPYRARRVIPRRIRRLPLFRDIETVQYSIDRDTERKLEKLKKVFPQGLKVDDDEIEYEHTPILAMSARVGSTALLSSLQRAGLSDHEIREIFNNRGYTEHFVERLGVTSLCQYLNEYSRRSGQRRLPFKIGWWDMAPLLSLLDDEFETWFPNASWVYLQRRDRVAQAYSLWKGMKHNVWHVHDGENYQCPVDSEIPVDEVRELLSLIEAENYGWQTYFTNAGIKPVCIYYEDFAADPKSVAEQAYRGFTGSSMTGRFECPIIKSSDAADHLNVEQLRLKLAA